MGRKISYQLLRSKITDLWKPSEPLTLIDLGHGFYTAKFNKEENKTTALHGGPRFIVGRFLSMISWKLSFVLSISTMTHTAIWVRLPQLPTELYDWQILKKIDPIREPVTKAITIGDYMQLVEYEGDDVLCVGYGRVGYTLKNCTFTPPLQISPVASSSATTTISLTLLDKEEDMWKLVSFPKKKIPEKQIPRPDSTLGSTARPANGVKSNTTSQIDSEHHISLSTLTDTISVDQRQSQDIDNRFNVLSENIPVEKNVQSPTVADKTLKVMSIKPNAPLRDQPI
ncbi:hypothetical protein FXO37_21992 [Capsicum annuum]|nr:hypothetical protein FXO37_21992 [Capsicum annuum]